MTVLNVSFLGTKDAPTNGSTFGPIFLPTLTKEIKHAMHIGTKKGTYTLNLSLAMLLTGSAIEKVF